SVPSRPDEQSATGQQAAFQSRCGFLSRRDAATSVPVVASTSFNPGVGFCPVATDRVVVSDILHE
ncbi:hypothetical protein KI372_00630, partial [Halobacterium salinarum]|nr:hypothetical protein [Halobacterium salinarum]